jgi:ppGpp synthetase/RelA/SpoT-type nucleotidyltranferase
LATTPQPFDFQAHRRRAVEQYQTVRRRYAEYSQSIKDIIKKALTKSEIKVASVEARAKSIRSYGRKASEPSDTDPSQPKYPSPMSQITDLAGVRIITFFPNTVSEVDRVIGDEFVVLERIDKAAQLLEEERFGYQSVHYLVKLKPNRTSLPEYGNFADLVAEVQVRTILQHAWAEIEHDIQYKSVKIIPAQIRRRFASLAGLLEIADREFQAIQGADERLREEVRASVEEGKLENVEVTPDALKAYLDRKLGADGRMTEFSYEWTARYLHEMGFKNLLQIEECVAGYGDDELSRIVYPVRQGQLTRFETLLLAGMGEYFVSKHPFSKIPGLRLHHRVLLDRLKIGGVEIKDYRPREDNKEDTINQNA